MICLWNAFAIIAVQCYDTNPAYFTKAKKAITIVERLAPHPSAPACIDQISEQTETIVQNKEAFDCMNAGINAYFEDCSCVDNIKYKANVILYFAIKKEYIDRVILRIEEICLSVSEKHVFKFTKFSKVRSTDIDKQQSSNINKTSKVSEEIDEKKIINSAAHEFVREYIKVLMVLRYKKTERQIKHNIISLQN